MGKRTTNEKRARDYWPTKDPGVIPPLLNHLPPSFAFDEPCAGSGDLVNLIASVSHRIARASDIHPGVEWVEGIDVFDLINCEGDCFITNPPWTWGILTRIIPHLSDIAPAWLLLNADLMHNKRMGPHMARCVKVASVGRVSWMNNGKKGFENAAWYLFDGGFSGQTEFYCRQ